MVGYHREIHHFSEEKSTKNLPPRNTPDSFCRRFTPTKSIAALHGRYFSLWETHLENFMSRPNVIPTFQPTPLQNRGRNCVRSKRRPPYMSSTTSTYFFALTIRKHLLKMRFERSGRGQEPSRGHKFSILENFLFIRDFTSQTLASFPSDLVGVALVGATPLHLLSQTALPLKSPTGAFIAALRKRGPTPNPAHHSCLAARMERRVVLT